MNIFRTSQKTPRFNYVTNILRKINVLLWQLDQRGKYTLWKNLGALNLRSL